MQFNTKIVSVFFNDLWFLFWSGLDLCSVIRLCSKILGLMRTVSGNESRYTWSRSHNQISIVVADGLAPGHLQPLWWRRLVGQEYHKVICNELHSEGLEHGVLITVRCLYLAVTCVHYIAFSISHGHASSRKSRKTLRNSPGPLFTKR